MVTDISRRGPREQLKSLTWEPFKLCRNEGAKRRATGVENQERDEVSSRPAMHGSEDGMEQRMDSLTYFTGHDLPRLQIRVPCYNAGY